MIGGPPPSHFPKRKVSCPAPAESCPSRCRVLWIGPAFVRAATILIVDIDWRNPLSTLICSDDIRPQPRAQIFTSAMDVQKVRANFPALSQDQVFFDNAGGSQVLGSVVDS